MAGVNWRGAARPRDGRGGRRVGKKRWCCADGTFMMSCAAEARSWKRRDKGAKRKRVSAGASASRRYQTECLVLSEGLKSGTKTARVSLTVRECALFFCYSLVF